MGGASLASMLLSRYGTVDCSAPMDAKLSSAASRVLGEMVMVCFLPLLPQASTSWKARMRDSLSAVMVLPLVGSVTLASCK